LFSGGLAPLGGVSISKTFGVGPPFWGLPTPAEFEGDHRMAAELAATKKGTHADADAGADEGSLEKAEAAHITTPTGRLHRDPENATGPLGISSRPANVICFRRTRPTTGAQEV
jgi:hypothetical protein